MRSLLLYFRQSNEKKLKHIRFSLLFQVTYQLKILATALCACLVLDKRLSLKHWGALVLLTVGVVLVQCANLSPDAKERDETKASGVSYNEYISGVLAVLMSCAFSGFSGVYYEKLVKKSEQTSVIIRNLQLGMKFCY